jgi:general secretion pathway protein M
VTVTRLASRLLALVLPLALLAVLWFAIGQPILASVTGDAEALRASRTLLAGYRRAIANRPAIEQHLAMARQADAALTGLLPGASATLAAAALQAEMKRLVEDAGGQLRSTQDLPAAAEAGFERVEARFDLALPLSGLPNLLGAIESHAPFLFLDKIEIHASETVGTMAVPLSVRWTVHGYRRPGSA